MTLSIKKGYYCLDRSFVDNGTINYGMSYVKAGGDMGLSFHDAIVWSQEHANMVVVDENGAIVFDPMRVN